MPNGIDLVLADHAEVDELFAAFDADPTDGTLVGRVVAALQAHDDAEQAALYPLVGQVLGDADTVMEAAAAHAAVKKQIDLLVSLEGPPLVAAVARLRELVTDHVRAEQDDVLPALAAAATPAQLEVLGARFLQAKARGG